MSNSNDRPDSVLATLRDKVFIRDFALTAPEPSGNQNNISASRKQSSNPLLATEPPSSNASVPVKDRIKGRVAAFFFLSDLVYRSRRQPGEEQIPSFDEIAAGAIGANHDHFFNAVSDCAHYICLKARSCIANGDNVRQNVALVKNWQSSIDRYSSDNKRAEALVGRDELIEMFREALNDMVAILAEDGETRMVCLIGLEQPDL